MDVSRRTTLRGLGAAGAALAVTGSALSVGAAEHDDREEEDDEEPAPNGVGAVRVGHYSPDAPNVDVYVDGDRVVADLGYREVTPYLEIEPGTYTVTVTAADDAETVAFEGDVEFGEAFHTVAATGELEENTFQPRVLVDAGSALIRVVHASPDAPAVQITPEGADEALFPYIAPGTETDYVAVPAGAAALEISPADVEDDDPEAENDETEAENGEQNGEGADMDDEEDDVVATVDVDLETGFAYSAFAVGYLEPPEDADDREFEVLLEVDGPEPEESPDEVPEEPEPDEEMDDEEMDDEEEDDHDEEMDEEEDDHDEEMDDEDDYDDERKDEKNDEDEY